MVSVVTVIVTVIMIIVRYCTWIVQHIIILYSKSLFASAQYSPNNDSVPGVSTPDLRNISFHSSSTADVTQHPISSAATHPRPTYSLPDAQQPYIPAISYVPTHVPIPVLPSIHSIGRGTVTSHEDRYRNLQYDGQASFQSYSAQHSLDPYTHASMAYTPEKNNSHSEYLKNPKDNTHHVQQMHRTHVEPTMSQDAVHRSDPTEMAHTTEYLKNPAPYVQNEYVDTFIVSTDDAVAATQNFSDIPEAKVGDGNEVRYSKILHVLFVD